MSNNYFKFKQFTINQENAAAKVGVDSVLLGVYANIENANNILDIGTGTGLLALMAAQRNNNAIIDAVEIDSNAYITALENIKNSDWKNRINLHNTDIKEFTSNTTKKYDAIISNPPYFENSLKSDNNSRNTARHTDSLSFSDLLECVSRVIDKNGYLSIILPIDQTIKICSISANYDLHCTKQIKIQPHCFKPANRAISIFETVEKPIDYMEICIRNSDKKTYSSEYKILTKAFYL